MVPGRFQPRVRAPLTWSGGTYAEWPASWARISRGEPETLRARTRPPRVGEGARPRWVAEAERPHGMLAAADRASRRQSAEQLARRWPEQSLRRRGRPRARIGQAVPVRRQMWDLSQRQGSRPPVGKGPGLTWGPPGGPALPETRPRPSRSERPRNWLRGQYRLSRWVRRSGGNRCEFCAPALSRPARDTGLGSCCT